MAMSGKRIFVGRLSYRATVDDLEHFFRDYGHIKDVDIKTGYGFVELDSSRDAEDAVRDLNGRTLCGERVTVEFAKAPDWRGGYGGRGGGGGDNFRNDSSRRRYGPPERTEHRIIIQNLSSRVSWQTLKDIMRKAGEVAFADAHRNNRNEAIVEFTTRSGLKKALERFDGYELYDRRLKVFEDRDGSYDDGRGRRRRNSSRSRSRSRSGRRNGRNRSRSRSSSRSRSPPRRSRAKDSRSRSLSSHRRCSSRSRSVSSRGSSHRSRSKSERERSVKSAHQSKSPSPVDRDQNGHSNHSQSNSPASAASDKHSEKKESNHGDTDSESGYERRSRSKSSDHSPAAEEQ